MIWLQQTLQEMARNGKRDKLYSSFSIEEEMFSVSADVIFHSHYSLRGTLHGKGNYI